MLGLVRGPLRTLSMFNELVRGCGSPVFDCLAHDCLGQDLALRAGLSSLAVQSRDAALPRAGNQFCELCAKESRAPEIERF